MGIRPNSLCALPARIRNWANIGKCWRGAVVWARGLGIASVPNISSILWQRMNSLESPLFGCRNFVVQSFVQASVIESEARCERLLCVGSSEPYCSTVWLIKICREFRSWSGLCRKWPWYQFTGGSASICHVTNVFRCFSVLDMSPNEFFGISLGAFIGTLYAPVRVSITREMKIFTSGITLSNTGLLFGNV